MLQTVDCLTDIFYCQGRINPVINQGQWRTYLIMPNSVTLFCCRGLSDDAAYVHICGNETMSGMTFHTEPEVGASRVLVADMTSSLLSRPVDVSKYGVIYASSGKNLGPAGNCVVIVRDDLIGNELPQVFACLFIARLLTDASTPPTE